MNQHNQISQQNEVYWTNIARLAMIIVGRRHRMTTITSGGGLPPHINTLLGGILKN